MDSAPSAVPASCQPQRITTGHVSFFNSLLIRGLKQKAVAAKGFVIDKCQLFTHACNIKVTLMLCSGRR